MSADKRDRSRRGQDPHREREQARYDSPIASREHILATLGAEKAPMDLARLGEVLELGDDDAREALRRRVMAMLRDGQLIENRKQGLVPVDASALVAGRVSAHKDGFGFLVPDEGGDDIFLNGKQMRQVLHGDRVVAAVTGTDRRGRREGRIVEVVERANQSLVGRLIIEHGVAFVSPDNKRIHQDLMIQPDALQGAVDHDIVVAEIVEQPTVRQPPVGRVVEVLGEHLQPGMEIDVALRSHGIPSEWPDPVQEQAGGFSTEVDEADKGGGRRDVRDLPLVTIDGADARDFDDAVFCERTEAGGWRLLVAIADVAHYVRPGSALDDEAIKRGTSVYFPGRVVPMLPEVLSNGLCSLNPNVDRLCMLCEMTLDSRGQLRRARFHNAVMRSHARLIYDQVNEMLNVPGSPLATEYQAVLPMIRELHALYTALARSRKRRGALEFESNETRIVFDDNRKISELVPVVRNDAHKLIEECMILANICAAALLERHEVPALYRVHAQPKPEKLEDLRAFLALQGLSLGGGDSPTGLDYGALARLIEERPDKHVIQTVMLRSMQQAVYQPKNEGHFGLALQQYAHFTSPIRRYPDLLVHRGIKHILSRAKATDYRYTPTAMQGLGESCSSTERRAEEASRDVLAWLKCEFMLERIGSQFPGVVTAVTSFGLFIELDGVHVEGLIHVTSLDNDFYRYDNAAQSLVGERTGKRYRLGDAMVVSVENVNLDERKIDFGEVSHTPAVSGKAERVQRGKDKESAKDQGGGKEKSRDKDKHREKDRNKGKRRSKDKDKDKDKGEAEAEPIVDSGSRKEAPKKGRRGKSSDQRREEAVDPSTTERPAGRNAASIEPSRSDAPEPESPPVSAAIDAPADPAPAEIPATGSSSDEAVAAAGAEELAPSDGEVMASAGGEKVAAKRSTTRKVAAKKTTSKKTAAKKTAAKKVAAKKVAAKKTAAKKTAAKKTAAKKTAAKKVATKKKAVAKKSASSKVGATKRSSSATGEPIPDGSSRDD